MDHQSSAALELYKNYVGIKFQLYNSLFTSLPFNRIEKTGLLLSLLANNCEDGYKRNMSPIDIIEDFFNKHTLLNKEEARLDILFRFIQYAERQVVLFDALEDAAFKYVNNMMGTGTLKYLEHELLSTNISVAATKRLSNFSLQLVLTAHPTQFYPGAVLGIIHDLAKSLEVNDTEAINMYLQQLGRTPFFKKKKPTPYDEAVSLIWYLEHVFYAAVGNITNILKGQLSHIFCNKDGMIKMGFWPGGDRDGNPFVTASTTLQVANALRTSIIRSYYKEVRSIRRRLTFDGVDHLVADLEKQLYQCLTEPDKCNNITADYLIASLQNIKQQLVYNHNSLFIELVSSLIDKIEIFGLHFATLDIRQDSAIHAQFFYHLAENTETLSSNYIKLNEPEQIESLLAINTISVENILPEGLLKDTLETIKTILNIQHTNGPAGCNRYIISQCNSALNVIEVMALFYLVNGKEKIIPVDIIPLFETIDDLKNAADIMEKLYTNEVYKSHLSTRRNKQTIMLGFSDGTKDGGYFMANWGIYKAKEALTNISLKYNIEVAFFDGRGGPPARGGGKTHKFYASMGNNIANHEIQLTIQGQTISSNFGTVDAAQFNIEQLLHAGISNQLFEKKEATFNASDEAILQQIANLSYDAYVQLKSNPQFLNYLSHASPLNFYADTNIGSRPAKKGGASRTTLKDLRAIPFVGAWSQLKQNVTGYYGLGTALKKIDELGYLPEVKRIYKESLFFKTMLENCEMAMKKCFFPLTAYLANHELYGEMWNNIYAEYELTKKYIFLVSSHTELMANYPVEQHSIQTREKIVLPLTTIQQFAIARVRYFEENNLSSPLKSTYEKLVMRCSFGIINAGRNSA